MGLCLPRSSVPECHPLAWTSRPTGYRLLLSFLRADKLRCWGGQGWGASVCKLLHMAQDSSSEGFQGSWSREPQCYKVEVCSRLSGDGDILPHVCGREQHSAWHELQWIIRANKSLPPINVPNSIRSSRMHECIKTTSEETRLCGSWATADLRVVHPPLHPRHGLEVPTAHCGTTAVTPSGAHILRLTGHGLLPVSLS